GSASRSASSRTTPPAGPSAMARSCSARSPITTTACANPNTGPVDAWTTQVRCPQAHRISNNRPERNENCVTYVVGLNCYLCPRLLKPKASGEGDSQRVRMCGSSPSLQPSQSELCSSRPREQRGEGEEPK